MDNKGTWAVILREHGQLFSGNNGQLFSGNKGNISTKIFLEHDQLHIFSGNMDPLGGAHASSDTQAHKKKTFQAELSERRTQGFPRMGNMESISKFTLELDP